jgi:CBS domain-containing protein
MPYRSIRQIIEERECATAPSGTTVSEAARLMREKRVGAVLVVEEGRLTGIVTERDVLYRVVAEGRDAQAIRLAEVMTANPQTIHPDKPFPDALHMMHEGGYRHVPVVDDGRPIGIVSARDALGPELEDFIYEILRREQASDILA